MESEPFKLPEARHDFMTTRWSLVAAAGQPADAAAEALESLCRDYWYPLYAYIRRRGHTPHEAEDLVQGFFVMLLARRDLAKADPQRGRFRAFLLQALKNYVSNQYERERAQKRGGDRRHLSLDLTTAEGRYLHEPQVEATAETLFDRQWATTLLAQVRETLAQEYRKAGKEGLFQQLEGLLTGLDNDSNYAAIAGRLDMTAGAVKVAVHRLRRRFGARLRELVAQTVTSPEELEEELQDLMTALQR
ncbi:MAG: RNA polymerase sigma factor [Pirellulaceae bacterium]